MCLIAVFNAKTTRIHESWLRDWYDHNPDGFGFILYTTHKLDLVRKGVFPAKPRYTARKSSAVKDKFGKNVAGGYELAEGYDIQRFGRMDRGAAIRAMGSADQFVKTFRAVEKAARCRGTSPWVVMHLRLRTHGLVDFHNTHPYHVKDNAWMVHNGILSHGNESDKSKSDTWHYVKDKLSPLVSDYGEKVLDNPAIASLIRGDIGDRNKFVFFNEGMKSPRVVNMEAGIMYDGVWLSNTYAWTSEARHSGALKDELIEPPPVQLPSSAYSGPRNSGMWGGCTGSGNYSLPFRTWEDGVPAVWENKKIDLWSKEDRSPLSMEEVDPDSATGYPPTRRGLYSLFHDFMRTNDFFRLTLIEKEALVMGGVDAITDLWYALDQGDVFKEIKSIAEVWVDETAAWMEAGLEDEDDGCGVAELDSPTEQGETSEQAA